MYKPVIPKVASVLAALINLNKFIGISHLDAASIIWGAEIKLTRERT